VPAKDRSKRRRLRKEAHRDRDRHRWTLDELDPPAWGPPPPDATGLMELVYALRPREVESFSVEDLRLAIGQEIALRHLMPLAIRRLEENALAEGDFYPGDLLSAVLRVDESFWSQNPELKRQLCRALDQLDPEDEDLDKDLTEKIERFRAR
jgi:hypothetical protein